jgi:amphi-Trp domain-containing protein
MSAGKGGTPMPEAKYFKYESVQDMETIVRYLEALAEGFRKGELTLAREGETLVMKPAGLLGFSVEAKLKGVRRKLKFTLGWKEQAESTAGGQPPLIIRASGEPGGGNE